MHLHYIICVRLLAVVAATAVTEIVTICPLSCVYVLSENVCMALSGADPGGVLRVPWNPPFEKPLSLEIL